MSWECADHGENPSILFPKQDKKSNGQNNKKQKKKDKGSFSGKRGRKRNSNDQCCAINWPDPSVAKNFSLLVFFFSTSSEKVPCVTAVRPLSPSWYIQQIPDELFVFSPRVFWIRPLSYHNSQIWRGDSLGRKNKKQKGIFLLSVYLGEEPWLESIFSPLKSLRGSAGLPISFVHYPIFSVAPKREITFVKFSFFFSSSWAAYRGSIPAGSITWSITESRAFSDSSYLIFLYYYEKSPASYNLFP